jgi:hypothetical protein
MAQNHVDLPPPPPDIAVPARGRVTDRPGEAHVVVATQDLPRMSGAIRALMRGGYLVTAYASPTRLLPRFQRISAPVALLVIDGGLTPAFARAAAIAARAAHAELPIILLASARAARCADFMPEGVTVLPLPVSEAGLLAAAATLAPTGRVADSISLS